MTASKLSRKLLYYGCDEMKDYLMKSPLNRYLYKLLLDVLPKYNLEIPILTMFNEIYYQCAHINYDGSPGVDIEQRYLEEEAEWLQSKPAAELVFCIVKSLLEVKVELSFYEECFLTQITPIVRRSAFCEISARILDELRHLGLLVLENFSIMTSPVNSLFRFFQDYECRKQMVSLYIACKKDADTIERNLSIYADYRRSWSVVTYNYNHRVIEKLIDLGLDLDDQLALLRYIRASYLDENLVHDKYYLDGLEEEIINGKFKVEEIPSTRRFYSQLLNPEEQSQYRQYLCLDRVTSEQDLNGQQLPDIEKKETANTNSPELLISEMVEYVKKNYSKSAASEFCTMCYRLLLRQGGRIDEDTAQLLDGIDSAIILRDAPHPNVDISSAHQVNINPQKVENNFKEAK